MRSLPSTDRNRDYRMVRDMPSLVAVTRLDLDRIRRAQAVIDPVFLDSSQYERAPLGDALGCSITLKVETLNPVRSFKRPRHRDGLVLLS
jgi:hypothetical protein